jgi:hypothetical protein
MRASSLASCCCRRRCCRRRRCCCCCCFCRLRWPSNAYKLQAELQHRIHTLEQAAIGLPFIPDSPFVHGLMDHARRPGEARDFTIDPATGGLVYRYVVPEHVCAVEGLAPHTDVRACVRTGGGGMWNSDARFFCS